MVIVSKTGSHINFKKKKKKNFNPNKMMIQTSTQHCLLKYIRGSWEKWVTWHTLSDVLVKFGLLVCSHHFHADQKHRNHCFAPVTGGRMNLVGCFFLIDS